MRNWGYDWLDDDDDDDEACPSVVLDLPLSGSLIFCRRTFGFRGKKFVRIILFGSVCIG